MKVEEQGKNVGSMRIEEHHGKKIVCGKFFKHDEIEIGSRWQGSGGFVVEVVDVKKFEWSYQGNKQVDYDVYYKWFEDGIEKFFDKDIFNFQCRYCLIIEN